MMINAPNHTLTAQSFVPAHPGEHPGVVEWMLKRIQSIVCGLHGHDSVLQYERNRMFLRCTSCGHETPGWEVEPGGFVMRRSEPRQARASEFEIVRKIA